MLRDMPTHKSVKLKESTYKELRIAAISAGMTFTQFIEMLLKMYLEGLKRD